MPFFNQETFVKVGIVIFAIVILYMIYSNYQNTQNIRNRIIRRHLIRSNNGNNISDEDNIFISVASYRDAECGETLYDIFHKAAMPHRIFIGVCQQNAANDIDCLENYKRLVGLNNEEDFSANIRVLRLPFTEARGPTYARSLIERQLFGGEKYYLITDSHMLFTYDWDISLLKMYEQCKTASTHKTPILTMYPDNFQPLHRQSQTLDHAKAPGSYLRIKKINKLAKLPELEGPLLKYVADTPIRGMFWAACFAFTEASIISKVPYINFPYVFFGEEIVMSALLYSHGYEFFHPQTMIAYHQWRRTNRPVFWELLTPAKKRQRKIALEQLRALLTSTPNIQNYGDLIGFDFQTQQFTHAFGLLGVHADATLPEIRVRFGSMQVYHQQLEKQRKQIKNLQK